MKLIKPMRLSVLHRCYRWQQSYHLGVAALALVPLRGQASLLTEMELWRMVAEQMPGVTALDAAIPKQCPEFLVSGSAYGRYCDPETGHCEVGVRVGKLEKRIRVSGDRLWNAGAPTQAQAFEQIPLDWTRTFGGPGMAENPLGRGLPVEGEVQSLPNLEPLDQHLAHAQEIGRPIGFGMVDETWPQRYRLADDYDDRWFEEDFPGFSRNIDWRYFNTAQPDQWFEGLDAIPPGAAYELTHMHPTLPKIAGKLPVFQARAFLRRKSQDEGTLEEMPLRLTTLWFVPHCERAILVFHGSVRCEEFDADDIASLVLAADDPRAPRELGHYLEVFERRQDPKQGALHALRDVDLVPEALIGPGLEALVEGPPAGGALMQRLNQRAEMERASIDERLAAVPKSKHAPQVELPPVPRLQGTQAPPSLDNLAAFVEMQEKRAKEGDASVQRLKSEMREREARIKQLEARALAKAPVVLPARQASPPPRGVQPTLDALRRELMENPLLKDMDAAQRRSLEAVLEQSAAMLTRAFSLGAHLMDAAPAVDEAGSQQIRAQVRERLDQGLSLAGLGLAGADLSGIDFQGADLAGLDLDSANLSRCNFTGANLCGAVLSRTRLDDARLDNCDLSDANLGLAQVWHASLRGANLSRVCLEQSKLDCCDLRGARLSDVRLKDADLKNLDLTGASVENLALFEASLAHLCLHGAQIDNLTFYRCTLHDFDFSRARICALSLIETDASHGISFQAAQISKSCFIGASNLARADFSACEMNEVCLRGARLEGADFTFSLLNQTDLSDTDLRDSRLDRAELDGDLLIRSDLRGASLRSASLVGSVLQSAHLESTDLSNSNLFRADLGEIHVDDDSVFEGAYQERVKHHPRRPTAATARGKS